MSNCCESIFSVSGHTLLNGYGIILAMNFESQMFRFLIDKCWVIDDVKVIISNEDSSKI